MHPYVVDLRDTQLATPSLVGGKAAHLTQLMTIEGLLVPDGFCVTTEAFHTMMATVPGIDVLLDTLATINRQDRLAIATNSAAIRAAIIATAIPAAITASITRQLHQHGAERAYAVRSSATAEDLPTASFAGQQDSYLHITGIESILLHIRQCWASLFTERAVSYRQQQGFDHRKVQLAVVVQHMVDPQAAGVLFTADPVSGHRQVTAIDAIPGLGEALVAGRVNPDHYTVREGAVVSRQAGVEAVTRGGREAVATAAVEQVKPVLTDQQVLQLAAIGRRIEQHFGSPQDIEWCLAEGLFYIVQSRPITTLFPIPAATISDKQVYISVGHQQMMTDAMKPLGLSFFLLMTPASMRDAGGRLFVDVAPMLVTPAGREAVMNSVGKSDPLIKDALQTIIDRGDILPPLAADHPAAPRPLVTTLSTDKAQADLDPGLVQVLIGQGQASIAVLKAAIQSQTGARLLSFIREDIQRLKQYIQGPDCLPAIMASMNAAVWINERMYAWLGEANVADILAQSVPDNVTSEMGLALLDVADVVRPYPAIVQYLQQVRHEDFLQELATLEGGQEVRAAIDTFLHTYGMRCTGEIDITRPRWSERPATLIPLILGNVQNQLPGAGKRKFEEGQAIALAKKEELLKRLQALPDGGRKATEAARMIDQLRHFAGYREYPKYFIVSRYALYKEALLREAQVLVQAGLLRTPEDMYWLRFDELEAGILAGQFDHSLIDQRKTAFPFFEQLRPPRVMTSDGEVFHGAYRQADLPPGAIAGLAVSAGIVEGRARVITDLSAADLAEGDILVTTFTDPGWTPLFVSIKGLVTEVGGLMTHGAVIAREYGLPAVVGVEQATRLIKDGQRIRVNGTAGYVEIL